MQASAVVVVVKADCRFQVTLVVVIAATNGECDALRQVHVCGYIFACVVVIVDGILLLLLHAQSAFIHLCVCSKPRINKSQRHANA